MCPPDSSAGARRHDRQWLAEELRREGLAERPPFSAALHQRIWEAVMRQAQEERPRPPRRRRVGFGPAAMAAAAVAAACAAGLLLWLGRPARRPALPSRPAVAQPQPLPSPLPEPVELPRVASMAPDVTKLPALVDLAASPRWAWLDHDARLTVETLAGQLPRDLATAWSSPGPEKTP